MLTRFVNQYRNHCLTKGRATQASLTLVNARWTRFLYKLKQWAKCI